MERQWGVRGAARLLVLVCAVTAAGGPARAAPASPVAMVAPDLAALTLRPADLPEPGWAHDGAFFERLDDLTQNQAEYWGDGTTATEVARALRAAGWERHYVRRLALATDASEARPAKLLRSYIIEYRDAGGAADGFAYLEDERSTGEAEDLPLERRYGDEAELTRDRGAVEEAGRPFRSLDLTFRRGNLVAGVTLISDSLATSLDADLRLVTALGETLERRVASPTATGPGLGSRALRLERGRMSVVTYDDAYYRLAGDDVPLVDEMPDAARRRTASYAEATDVYQLWQGVSAGTAAGVLYGVTLLRFPDAASAEGWIAGLETTLAASPYYRGVRMEESARDLGDGSTTLSYVPSGGGTSARALLIAVRVGTDVARVHLVPQGALSSVPRAALSELAQAQTACLASMACVETASVPASLVDLLTAAEAPPTRPSASPVATPAG